MIRVDALWLSTWPLDMRAGTETILAQVVRIFGEAQPHHAYLFANRRGTRLKVLVHDGYGVWLANRRLNQGRFQLRCRIALTRPPFLFQVDQAIASDLTRCIQPAIWISKSDLIRTPVASDWRSQTSQAASEAQQVDALYRSLPASCQAFLTGDSRYSITVRSPSQISTFVCMPADSAKRCPSIASAMSFRRTSAL